ncbi:membrane protein [Skeletonema marinoi]|uniref:Membrane protein n=1 Tax=Skeletonema marinoi TaxID=267567 RepID=A0AAD8YC99_9STRA|nr:membrane protein [Skeletonema marinoi]
MVAAALAARQPRSTRDVSIPYHSMTVILAVAILSPLSIFVLSIFFATQQHQNNTAYDEMEEGMRYLQQDCINATATDDQTLTTTWQAVKITSFVASSVAVLCAIGYELFRRDPIVGKYVYDRKRLKEPDRTPPPLMQSRSLWTGTYDDPDDSGSGGKQKMTCWKVKPAILELLFINLDHKYVRYSKAADEARKKREERGQYTCCRKGWYHNCCFCNKRKLNNERNDDLFVDEDGFEYFPGHDYTLDEEVIAKRFEYQWSKTINDLFPAERICDSLGAIEESVDTCVNEQGSTDSDPEFLACRSIEGSMSGGEEFFNCDVIGDSVGEIDESADTCVNEQVNTDADPESLALRSTEGTLATGCISGREESLNNCDGTGKKKPSYPYRLVYLFMPPGFHVWNNALPYMSHFFWFPSIVRRFNILFRTSYVTNDDISLTEPEKELLHCVGLDIYLLIRFTRLGFDLTYYPFLVSCITVLPVYHVASIEGASRNNYLSNTINSIENGSQLIWVVLVFSVVYFLYVLRRLWVEWEVFIQLRHDFLARGTRHFYHNNAFTTKYQKTCIVECVPDEYRTDAALFDTFNKLFPNQIECAEMLAETSKLDALVGERKKLIVRHENADALHRYRCWKNTRTKLEEPRSEPVSYVLERSKI